MNRNPRRESCFVKEYREMDGEFKPLLTDGRMTIYDVDKTSAWVQSDDFVEVESMV